VVCFFFFSFICRLLPPENVWKAKLWFYWLPLPIILSIVKMHQRYSLCSHFSDGRDQFLDSHFLSKGGRNFGLRGHGYHVFNYPTSWRGDSGFHATQHGGSGFDVNVVGGSGLDSPVDDCDFYYPTYWHGGSGFDALWWGGSGFDEIVGCGSGFVGHVDNCGFNHSTSSWCGGFGFDAPWYSGGGLFGSCSSSFNALVDDPLANYPSSPCAGSQPFIDAASKDLSICCCPGIPFDTAGKNQEGAASIGRVS
jgi:hypothetical protein